MKIQRRHLQYSFQMGFLTIEVMIALVLMILSITAVILVAYGNQDTLVGGETNREATQKAEEMLEGAQALTRKDFSMVNPVATGTDGIYHSSLSVGPVSSSDYFSKKITAYVTWADERNILREVSLTSVVTDFMNVTGGDTCSSALWGDWTVPWVANGTTDFAQLIGRGGDTFSLTDLDAYKGKLYVTAGHTPSSTDPTFFIFDISDPENPTMFSGGFADNASTTVDGLFAVAVAGNYAYVANNHTANFGTCTNTNGQASACAQMQIIGLAGVSPEVLYSFKVPDVTSGSGGVGKSIFYNNGYVYLGLTSTGGNGPEFNIIDVHDFPTTPPILVGSYAVGAGISAIVVKDNYAYLATALSGGTLSILNVNDKTHPTLAFTPVPSSFGNGKSVTLVGDTIYFGKTADPNTGELYVFHNPNPASIAPLLASTTETGSTIGGVRLRDYLAFLLTNNEFQIWNATTSEHTALSIPGVGSTNSSYQPFFDCEKNTFYVGGNNAINQGSLSVIIPSL